MGTRKQVPFQVCDSTASALCADHVLEQQAPQEIQPAEAEPEECNKDRKDQCQHTLGVDKGRPPNQYLNDPVHARNQQQNELRKTWQAIEPSDNTVF